MKRKNTIITQYYSLIVVTLFLFIVIGIMSCQYIIKNIFPDSEIKPPLYIAKLIDYFGEQDKITGIKRYTELRSGMPGQDLELLDAQGRIIYASNRSPETAGPDELHRLTKPYDYAALTQPRANQQDYIFQHIFKLHPQRPVFIVRLAGEPVYYLKITPPHYAAKKHKTIFLLIFSLVALVISLLLGVALSIFLIYLSINKHTKIANHVISELQNSNLKVRFPLNRMDEFGRAMLRFNQMATEMERIILTSQQAEKRRTNLLQELAHDLKTPISSLKMLLGTLETNDQHLDPHLKKELIGLSRKEVDYFAKLVEDLLLLARMSEPRYPTQQEQINLYHLLTEIIDDADFRESHLNRKKIIKKFTDDQKYIYGDEHLLRRAFRNALDNAIYYANQLVFVDIESAPGRRIKVIIQDDGHGFSEETMRSFGERLPSRKVTEKSGSKVSLGLGSVIIKTVCELHSASLAFHNVLDETQQVLGARLEIELSFC